MSKVVVFPAGGYRFIPSVFQYSAGVAAQPGFEIRRVQFQKPVPLNLGFDGIAQIIGTADRPVHALCACELRSPQPFSETGFRAFNEVYVATLKRWGLFDGTTNPVARCNVCPAVNPPKEPSISAFCFTVSATGAEASFAIAGSGEATEGRATYGEVLVRRGETTPDAMREKALFVLNEMERRMGLLGFGWSDATATQVYTVHNIHHFLEDEIVRRGAAHAGITWHYNRPPVRDLEFEMDCRGISEERVTRLAS